MKKESAIDRSYQNHKNEVIETDVPKSGFNLTYRNHIGGIVLGRLYPQSIQHLMPNDKFSGSNEANLTFERLATPVVDTMDVCVHNFLITLRSIDSRWEKFMTPTKLNNMNKNVSVPTFSLTDILARITIDYVGSLINWTSDATPSTPKVIIDWSNASYTSHVNSWNQVYHRDSLADLSDQIRAILGSTAMTVTLNLSNSSDLDKFKLVICAIYDFFVGKRSLLDYFGYKMVTRNDILSSFDNVFMNSTYLSYYCPSFDISDWLLNSEELTSFAPFTVKSYPLQNEYALRAYYAIWFEYYRNYDLEPRSSSLPEYHDFGATSIFGNPVVFANLHYLVPRIRSWQADAFTTAGIDDISRHVFAPILNTNFTINKDTDNSLQPTGILDNNVRMEEISWRNPATGVVSAINVPMPERLITLLQTNPSNLDDGVAGLELFSLRKAQMLENYLKRIYYGGDEYRDRMLHLYGARIEDYRINRPQWLSSSLDEVDPRQEVANTGISPSNTNPDNMPIGARVATATASQSGSDGFTEFCPEFGIYMSILSVMPHATYDPYLLQNMNYAYSDFPIPQFANQMEDVISTTEISRHVPHQAFGYAPYGHAYRYRVDSIHGDYHDDKFDYCFLRFWDEASVPNLSWSFIHCRPKLPMFVNSILLDGQCYGTFKHNFLVERPLPSPVETI